MANSIVTVNVSQTIAPTPSTLQRTGAALSQGGTILPAQNYALITELADLTPLLAAPLALTSLAWASTFGGQVTATTTVAHGIPVNSMFSTTIAGAVPAAYNGTVFAQATGASTFTYFLANPGTTPAGTPGTYTPAGVAELTAMFKTFFTQGAQLPAYVLELGAGIVSAGVTALANFITASPQFFYSYLAPRNWDGDPNFLTFLANYEATTSKTYFFVTTNEQNYDTYTALMKDVVTLIEAPTYRPWATQAVSAASISGGIATFTTANPHGVFPGDTYTIVGVTPVAYNGTYIALPGTTGSTLKGALAAAGSFVGAGSLVVSIYSSAGVPATEFSHASDWWTTLNYKPSTTNKVPPFAFSFLFGVTPFPTQGNSALLATLGAANINYVGSGAQGGISDTILFNGHTMDGRPFNYWYAVDWMQINIQLNIANAIINGSNTPINPLYYNQDGINRLQDVAASTGASAITFGLAIGKVVQVGLDGPAFSTALNSGTYAGQLVVNAVPFTNYTTENPSDYKEGEYDGLSMVFTPARGFEHIIFNINVTDFVSV